ncbi:glutathione S-transferase family protein [Devosia geojensis]|nr:glutathione S-transferase family protein [Devosia geojensis]
MGKITLWGRANSANVQKTMWALEELGLDYEHVPLGGSYKGLDNPAYLALNPNGLVPTLQDGDLTVWESHATVRYLAAAYGAGTLWPQDVRERAIADQWTDWTATTYQPAWVKVFWSAVRTPVEQQDLVIIADGLAATGKCLAILDRQLDARPFLAGGSLTYADIVAGVSLYRWFTMEIERPAAPNVARWYERLSEREAFRKAVMVSYAELVGRLAF